MLALVDVDPGTDEWAADFLRGDDDVEPYASDEALADHLAFALRYQAGRPPGGVFVAVIPDGL